METINVTPSSRGKGAHLKLSFRITDCFFVYFYFFSHLLLMTIVLMLDTPHSRVRAPIENLYTKLKNTFHLTELSALSHALIMLIRPGPHLPCHADVYDMGYHLLSSHTDVMYQKRA